MQNLWRRYEKKLLEVSCDFFFFFLWFDHKYHANILCQCVLAILPRKPRSEENYRQKKKKKKEYEVDFILEKCSREFYNFLVIFYFVSMFTTQHYKIIVKTKKCKLLSRIKTFSFPTVLRGTKI